MPVADYEYFRPYVEEVKAGRPEALLGAKNRLLMFSLTSGTTAQAKYIPITERFLSDYRSGWQAWGIQAIDAHPGINSRNILQLSSDYDLFRTPGRHALRQYQRTRRRLPEADRPHDVHRSRSRRQDPRLRREALHGHASGGCRLATSAW